LYDEARPHPPGILLDICTQLAHSHSVVVDLGSGTGLSTAMWAERAQTEDGNAQRFIQLTLSFGIARYLKHRYLTEQEVGLDHMQQAAQDCIGPKPIPWYFSYRVRIGIK